MRLPSFAAEKSLSRTKGLHLIAASSTQHIGSRSVLPQSIWNTGGVMEAVGCEFICIPNRYGAGMDCFWYCPGHIPYLSHLVKGLQ